MAHDSPQTEISINKIHLIIGLLLLVAALLIVLVAVNVRSQADNADTSASINNSDPVVDTVLIDSGAATVTLTENTTTDVTVSGTFHDDNGCDEVTTVVADFYRTSNGTGGGRDDLNYYQVSLLETQCSITNCTAGGTDRTGDFSCTVPVQYFADGTGAGAQYPTDDWTANVTIGDGTAFGLNSATIGINELTSLNAANVVFGALDVDGISGEITQTITNTGNNNALNFLLSGSDMSCTDGTIDVASLKYSSSTGVAYGSMTALTGTGVSVGMSITKAASTAAPSTADFYWRLQATAQTPTEGLSGSCAGTATLVAS